MGIVIDGLTGYPCSLVPHLFQHIAIVFNAVFVILLLQEACDPCVQVGDLNAPHLFRRADLAQIILYILCQIGREGCEEYSFIASTLLRKISRTVHSHDSLACACATQHACRSSVILVDHAPLRRMQEYAPLLQRRVHHGLKLFFAFDHGKLHKRDGIGQCGFNTGNIAALLAFAIEGFHDLINIKAIMNVFEGFERVSWHFFLGAIEIILGDDAAHQRVEFLGYTESLQLSIADGNKHGRHSMHGRRGNVHT